jgi:hypothetical protein
MKWLEKLINGIELAEFQLSVIVVSLTTIAFIGWIAYRVVFRS